MTLYSKIAADVVQPDLGEVVTLYEIHLTAFGGSIYRFAPTVIESGTPGQYTTVEFGGDTYYPRKISEENFGRSGEGADPRPKITIGDVDGQISTLCNSYNNLKGAIFKRRRTLKKYLDDQPGEDSSAEWPVEIYEIAQKSDERKAQIEFTLKSFLNLEGLKLPKVTVHRDTCTWTYRSWNGSSFDYPDSRACPYTASTYFKRDGTSTSDPAEDVCGKTLASCKLRYGATNPLPMAAAPGIDKLRR